MMHPLAVCGSPHSARTLSPLFYLYCPKYELSFLPLKCRNMWKIPPGAAGHGNFTGGVGRWVSEDFRYSRSSVLPRVTRAFCASDHLNPSGVLDILRTQQPCSPSCERAATPALASVQLVWLRESICPKKCLFWVVILRGWVSDLTEPVDRRVWGREQLEVWWTEAGQHFSPYLTHAFLLGTNPWVE